MAGVRRRLADRGGGGSTVLWRTGRLVADQHLLAKALQEVFEDHPEYAALYRNPDWGGCQLVAQRWLEVLPIPVEQKQCWWRRKTISRRSPAGAGCWSPAIEPSIRCR